MVLYYCEGKNTKTVYNVKKRGNSWYIYNIFTDENEFVTNVLIGIVKTKKAAIEAMMTTFDKVVEIRNPEE